MKKIGSLFLAFVLLAALLGGCGSSSYSMMTSAAPGGSNGSIASESAAVPAGWEPETAQTAAERSVSGPPANVKMIYTAEIALESTEFGVASAGLDSLTAEMGGWFESSRLDSNREHYRRATYIIRVPAENFEAFCTRVGDICKVNRSYTNSEDISERYYDMESRLITQRTKLERLQALLAQAENMEDIITLESAISETELAIENLTGSLRHYDSLVGYSTITITLAEVYQLTQAEEPAIGFGAKLAAAFRSGSRSFVTGVQNLLLGFARGWAGWLIFFAIVAAVVLLIVRGRRRRRERRDFGAPPKPRQARGKRRGAAADAAMEPSQETGPDDAKY